MMHLPNLDDFTHQNETESLFLVVCNINNHI